MKTSHGWFSAFMYSATWGWAFYINLCIRAVCAPVYLFLLHNKDPRGGVVQLVRTGEIDYVGCVLTVGACVSGVMPTSIMQRSLHLAHASKQHTPSAAANFGQSPER